MKNRNMIPNLTAAAAAGTLAVALVASPASAQTTTTAAATPTAVKKKPTSATPQMIDEAIQRSQARAAKAAATPGSPEVFGSEEPFTYKPR